MKRILFYLSAAAVLIISVVIKIPSLYFNLPVCANVDERAGVTVLTRFAEGSLNPHFFNYPTLFYYLVHFLHKAFYFTDIIFFGRVVNLGLSVILALLVFYFGIRIMHSKITGFTAMILVLFSQIISYNASYIITDILMTVLILISVIFYYKDFESPRPAYFYLSWIFAGLALSAKYSAIFLVAAYLIVIAMDTNSERTGARFNPKIVLAINVFVLALGLVLVLLPFTSFIDNLSFLSGNYLEDNDFLFIQKIKVSCWEAGGIFTIAGGLLLWGKLKLPGLYSYRFYLGAFIAFLFFLIGTLYSVIDFNSFMFGFGQEIKFNFIRGTTSSFAWIFEYFRDYEFITSIVLFLGGLFFIAKRKGSALLLIYVGISIVGLGLATRSYPRYLTPVLPFMYIIAGWGVAEFYKIVKGKTNYAPLMLFVIFSLIAVEVTARFLPGLKYYKYHDEFYFTYNKVLSYKPDKVIYSGFAPGVELKSAGFDVSSVNYKELPEADFKGAGNTVFIADSASNRILSESQRNKLQLIDSLPSGFKQYIYFIKP